MSEELMSDQIYDDLVDWCDKYGLSLKASEELEGIINKELEQSEAINTAVTDLINLKFKSGNTTQVSQITITRAEYEEAIK